jgi:hypothetical protein
MTERKKPTATIGVATFIITLICRFGLLGAFFTLLMIYGTKEQFREFIDTFILFKFPKNSGYLPYFVVLYMVLLLSGVIFYLKQRIKIKNERLQIIEKDLRTLQEMVSLNKRSRKTNKKV